MTETKLQMTAEVLYDVSNAGLGRAIAFYAIGLGSALVVFGIYFFSIEPQEDSSLRRAANYLISCLVIFAGCAIPIQALSARSRCLDDLTAGRYQTAQGVISQIRVHGSVGMEQYQVTMGKNVLTVSAGSKALNCGCVEAPSGWKLVAGENVSIDYNENDILKITAIR